MGWYDLPAGYGLAKMAEGFTGGMAKGLEDTAVFNQRGDIADRELGMRQQSVDLEKAKLDFMQKNGLKKEEMEFVQNSWQKVMDSIKNGSPELGVLF